MTITQTAADGSISDDEPPPLTADEPAQAWGRPIIGRLIDPAGNPDWGDWRWQMRHRIRNNIHLRQAFPQLASVQELAEVARKYPLAITPYYASLIRKLDLSDPIFALSVPQVAELYNPPFLSEDPLEEHEDMPVPGLVHRYADRALLIATTTCSSYCRHCTRKRVAGTREVQISPRRLEQVVAYLREHPEITDVIVSGGDPLTLATEALDRVLTAIRTVESVQIIRIGSRVPVVMPMRITSELTAMLRKHHPLWINTHFNHPSELTPDAARACAALVDAGIPLGNQTVLLRGVNDEPQVIEHLCRGLVRMRVRPYYLFQCDLVRGVEHFRTPLSRGIEVMEYLRGRLSGLAIPSFVVDAPHGGGKIPLLPSYIVSTSPTHTVLRNFEGMLVSYPEPGNAGRGQRFDQTHGGSIHDLASGKASAIVPADIARLHRRRDQHHDVPFTRELVE